MMNRGNYFVCFLIAGLAGCSSEPAAKQAAPPMDKIKGRALVMQNETTALDAALNAGGPSVYLVNGLNRYRLFFNKPFQVDPGKMYAAEGVYAQKAIDAIGDPDGGKHGYPLEASCAHVVRTAWPGMAFDETDSDASSLRSKISRFPARPVFLVTKIELVADSDSDKGKKDADAEAKDEPKVTVPADKQSVLRVDGPTVLPAPLWQPEGGSASCKVVIDGEGKIAELNSGSQLCEAVPWDKFHYKPTLKGGHPANVITEVEVHFEAHK